MNNDAPFWKTTALDAMTQEQWESLCDGCGKCCLQKFEDEDTGRMVYTNVACYLLDLDTCVCTDYPNRSTRVPDCVTLVPKVLEDPYWLPETCAYRLVAEGNPLPEWHPLLSEDPASVLCAGHSISGRVVSEKDADDPLLHLIEWVR